jgi:nitrogen fixation NifU-like protein
VKGKSVDEVAQIKNSLIVEELSLPPVKIHCSVLAEDAIKAAVKDWQERQATKQGGSGSNPADGSSSDPAAA